VTRYQRHIFICTNRRPAGHPKGCCAEKNSEILKDHFKAELNKRGIAAVVRANASGCLDACSHGASVVVYPEGIWYGGVTVEDVPEIIDRHIIHGEVVQRLLIKDEDYRPDQNVFKPLSL
jgi:(2Fe-2S) ferredoxin